MRKEWKHRPAPLLVEQGTRLAQEVLLRDGQHVPTLIVDGFKNPIVIQVERLAPTYEARRQQLYITGQAQSHEGTAGRVRSVYFVIEAWLSQAREGKPPMMRASQDPQRKEVLIVSGLSGLIGHRRQVHLAIFEMLRDEQGALQELRDYAFPDDPELAADTPLLEAFLTGFWAKGGLR